ncbi:MAG: hypothetical protein A3F16_04485 [Deltaproteobacteria bacterium RIFCSPHIGHO2_12_FULL_43_9]|nr:MAG: hypothetical protein A3F16_04485 [Deltaproteobacteria bacterium RIFCSPHIGHO2_12_FULL_43_9]
MKRKNFGSLFALPLLFIITDSANAMPSPSKDDINGDGIVDIIDRLEWERGRITKGQLVLPSTPPEIPLLDSELFSTQTPPALLVRSDDSSVTGSLDGVISIVPLVHPAMQIKFLIRALDWAARHRFAASASFDEEIGFQKNRLLSFARNFGYDSKVPAELIYETKNLIQRYVSEGLRERLFPEYFNEDVDYLFGKIENAIQWHKISFVSLDHLNNALKKLSGESVRSRKPTVEQNRLFKTAYNPNDTYFNPALRDFITTLRDAWAWDNARFPEAWDRTTGDTNLITAILDTGFDANHPDLRNRMWRNPGDPWNGIDDDSNGFVDDFQGWDFVGGGGWHTTGTWEDYNGHGTIMAGLIGADSNNGAGIAGASLLGKFMNVVVLNESGYGLTANIDAGMAYAIGMGADIINLSFSGSIYSPSLQSYAELAAAFGIAVVGVAGNNYGEEARFYSPANIREVISVGSTTPTLDSSTFSNVAFGIDIFAPGGGFPIAPLAYTMTRFAPEFVVPVPMSQTLYRPPYWYSLLTLTDPLYWRVAGTSISAAFTSGAANLIKSLNPNLTGEQIRQALRVAALQRGGQSGIVDEKGYGDLDAYRAVLLDPLLEVRILSPGLFSSKVQENVTIEGVVRNPGGLAIHQVELRYRPVGSTSSTTLGSFGGVRTVNYNWNISSLPDGLYYIELRARTSPSSAWSIDSMLVRKGPRWYEDVSDPTHPQIASYSVEGVDIDNDGDRDIAVANIGNFTGGVLTPMQNNIFVNDGHGTFRDETYRFQNQNPAFNFKLIPADFTGDGYVDFLGIAISITPGGDELFLWTNEGASNPGYFNRRPLVSGSTLGYDGAFGDIDGDQDLDLFIATAWETQNRLFRNDGRGNFTEISNQLPQELTTATAAQLADFDLDGDLDIIAGSWEVSGTAGIFSLQMYLNDGSGRFTNRSSSWFSRDIYAFHDLEVADLDSDGDPDVVSHNDYYLINEGNGFRAIPLNNSRQRGEGLFRSFEIGDVDRDGRPDLLALDGIHYLALKNEGVDPATGEIIWDDKTYDWMPSYRQIEVGVQDSDFVDWDSDGDLDIVVGANGNLFTESFRLYEHTQGLAGDVDGDMRVTILDALIVAEYIAGFGGWSASQVANGDIDGTPGLSITDVLVIARIAAHLTSPGVATPVTEFCPYCIGNPAF